jgi:hypothetical protein
MVFIGKLFFLLHLQLLPPYWFFSLTFKQALVVFTLKHPPLTLYPPSSSYPNSASQLNRQKVWTNISPPFPHHTIICQHTLCAFSTTPDSCLPLFLYPILIAVSPLTHISISILCSLLKRTYFSPSNLNTNYSQYIVPKYISLVGTSEVLGL